MKTLKILATAFILVSGIYLTGCNNSSDKTDSTTKDVSTEQKTDEQKSDGEVVTINLPTMQCNTCKKNITNAVKEVDGVKDVDVSVKDKTAKVVYDKSKVDVSKIEARITSAGYDANDKKADPNAYEKLDDCCKLPKDQKEDGMHM